MQFRIFFWQKISSPIISVKTPFQRQESPNWLLLGAWRPCSEWPRMTVIWEMNDVTRFEGLILDFTNNLKKAVKNHSLLSTNLFLVLCSAFSQQRKGTDSQRGYRSRFRYGNPAAAAFADIFNAQNVGDTEVLTLPHFLW